MLGNISRCGAFVFMLLWWGLGFAAVQEGDTVEIETVDLGSRFLCALYPRATMGFL